MMHMRLSEAAALLGARLHGADAAFRGLSTDTRTVGTGELFVALRGPNFDAHEFLDAARARGAAGALVERVPAPLPAIEVPDARAAMGQLAAHWRARHNVDTLAVTGSNGKTTVKEMIAAILARDAPVLATRGNLNNDIGVPLTLAGLDAGHRRLVVEMGANHPGEIAALAAMARPRIGVITLVAPAHLEGFGSIDAVARAKGELIAALPADGVAVVNADGGYQELWRELAAGRRLLRFGEHAGADVRVQHQAQADGARISLYTADGALDVSLRLAGRHNALNAAAAAAAALAAGVSLQCIGDGLASVRPVHGRLEILAAPGDVRVIDDTYNANPVSLRAALEVLAQFPPPRWLVLGDMGELGADATVFHREAGLAARALGIQGLFGMGPLARAAVQAFGAGGHHFNTHAQVLRALHDALDGGASVLVKGSRTMGMEQVVAALLHGEAQCC
jgi:UDP-N-acetylmuramoyl-tripeptide--D-alanyl-D-alanine ligase